MYISLFQELSPSVYINFLTHLLPIYRGSFRKAASFAIAYDVILSSCG